MVEYKTKCNACGRVIPDPTRFQRVASSALCLKCAKAAIKILKLDASICGFEPRSPENYPSAIKDALAKAKAKGIEI